MNPNLHVEPMGILEPLLLGGSDLGKIGVHALVEGVLLIQGNAVKVILKLRGPDGFGGCLGTNIPTHSGSRDPRPQAWCSLLPAPVRLRAGAVVSRVLLMNWRHVCFLRRFGSLTVLKPTHPCPRGAQGLAGGGSY